ncbi:MAG: acetate--CoA ligase family protein [Deltaproteobacteria bacterium]|nr:acetate--CoA ligase family protein [Deltaproteobacteria bacterium]
MRRTTLSGDEARRLLEAYGVRAARAMTIASPMAARRAASELGYPVTLTLRATGHVATRAALRDGDAVDDAIHALFADAPQADPALAFELRRTASAERFAALTVTADARLGGRVTLTATPGAGACALALTAAAAPEGLVARALGVAADAAPPELVALVARVAQLALDFPEIARLDVGPIAEEPGGFSVLAASATLPRDLLPSRR